ncbi:MAG: hypothetical protein ACRD2D_14020, partial [Terriglobales bacterium]
MIARLPIRFFARRCPFALALMLACLLLAAQSAAAQSPIVQSPAPQSPAPQSSSPASPSPDATSAPVVLDRVVAVVNNQAILESDLDEEMHLSVLEPNLPGRGRSQETSESALRRLISRALIRQQIREEDAQATEPAAKQVNDRIAELRRQLPVCLRANCAAAAGWQAFLAAHDLTEDAVRNYLQNRLEVLNFIELRFRQGIQISPQEIADYYQDTLLPQYLVGEPTPPLDQVAPRIEEILL